MNGVLIRQVTSHRFTSEGSTVFTLTDGIIVGRMRRDGGKTTYSVPALEVFKRYLEDCNVQEAAIVRAWAEDRIGKVAA